MKDTPVTHPFTEDVLPTLRDWRAAGRKAALVTLVKVDGSSPRPVGSQMAVAEDGEHIGQITGGCAEAALVAEAQDAIATGRNRTMRYGAGSPLIDIRLPCGSGIEVYFDATVRTQSLTGLLALRDGRTPCVLATDLNTHESWVERAGAPQGADAAFRRAYAPTFRLFAMGRGPILASLARLGGEVGIEMSVWSPDDDVLQAAAAWGAAATRLTHPDDFPADALDAWSGLALAFHDHDWEPAILARALKRPTAYLGALGSRATHKARCAALAELGCPPGDIARVRGPIGLDIGAKSPPEIALSILAEVVAARRLGDAQCN